MDTYPIQLLSLSPWSQVFSEYYSHLAPGALHPTQGRSLMITSQDCWGEGCAGRRKGPEAGKRAREEKGAIFRAYCDPVTSFRVSRPLVFK